MSHTIRELIRTENTILFSRENIEYQNLFDFELFSPISDTEIFIKKGEMRWGEASGNKYFTGEVIVSNSYSSLSRNHSKDLSLCIRELQLVNHAEDPSETRKLYILSAYYDDEKMLLGIYTSIAHATYELKKIAGTIIGS